MLSQRIGFIGGGIMATALVNGILRAGLTEPQNIYVSDPDPLSIGRFQALGVSATTENIELFLSSDIVILAVKPQVVVPVLSELKASCDERIFESKSFISIAAGVTISSMESTLPACTRSVIRVMPNTPCTVGECAAAMALGSRSQLSDKDICEKIFQAVGSICEVPEKLIDSVTGLSGSGPAYVFLFIEALADGGVRMGLTRDVALRLAAQTVKGAAAMVLESGKSRHFHIIQEMDDYWKK
jgi:pyrroline-5-carboxylate reductase